ncbi:hypothetical protein APS47_11655 [Leptospira kirschneri serovar Mozdok]|nr:hypothetical protein LEP1GSC018_4171 [Leptospira kirschneri str. 2008720114]KPZ77264.1 hypothetical protein APS47_11655 [Leptospira kirschneri serovar Mozdok]OOV47743.1 hypothetical protein B1J94_14995 [Leptospira kirschneri serovar Grippotyphosa]
MIRFYFNVSQYHQYKNSYVLLELARPVEQSDTEFEKAILLDSKKQHKVKFRGNWDIEFFYSPKFFYIEFTLF